jgi:hypothetical protein
VSRKNQIQIPHTNDPILRDFMSHLANDNRKLNKKIVKRDSVILDLSTRLRTIETFLDGMNRFKIGTFEKRPIDKLDLQVEELEP